MKPVQIEGTTQIFFPRKLFFVIVHISATGRCEYIVRKWPLRRRSVLEYNTSKSVVTVQCAFRAKYAKDLPTIHACHKQFTESLSSEEYRCTNIDLCGKNLNIVSMCAVSPVVDTSNISSCQKKTFSVFLWL
jgi:hypothetical protein